MNPKLIQETLQQTVRENMKEDGWTGMADLGGSLKRNGLDYKDQGFDKLLDLIIANSDIIEYKVDTSHRLPVYYVKNRSRISLKAKKHAINSTPKSALFDWAYLGNYQKTIQNLRDLSLNERWYYKEKNEEYPYPILVNYLHYTFYRLTKEKGKIMTQDDYATFNTGLVDKRYEPIFALFGKNRYGTQEWKLHEFCIAGEGRSGKDLIRNFSLKPERANYFDNVSELLYDVSAAKPELDWKHIILDNISRLPLSFIIENAPDEFEVKNPSIMTIDDRDKYFISLRDKIDTDKKAYRNMTNRFKDSLDLALKRVEWNFKTAIPMYFPTMNKMSLLLPLALVDDEIIDVALVVEKTKSGNYLGHTILPLKWAYSNARLVARPDSDWLVAEKIDTESDQD